MKKTLIFMLIVIVYSMLFMLANAVMPFSLSFKEASENTDPSSAIFLLISSIFNCFTIYFIAANSNWRGAKRAIGIIFVVFMIAAFMTQIETLFFGQAFSILTKADVVLIMLAMLPSIVAATLLGAKFFGNNEPAKKDEFLPILPLLKRIAVLGVIYTAVYFLFGYFVAWQFEELRVFYSGNAENTGFIGQLMNNANDNPIIYPFQFIRGVMFTLFLLPLLSMLWDKGRNKFIISVCLTYLTTAVVLIIPNVLFPDAVRWAHFIEMFSSMLVFGVITGIILYVPDKRFPAK